MYRDVAKKKYRKQLWVLNCDRLKSSQTCLTTIANTEAAWAKLAACTIVGLHSQVRCWKNVATSLDGFNSAWKPKSDLEQCKVRNHDLSLMVV